MSEGLLFSTLLTSRGDRVRLQGSCLGDRQKLQRLLRIGDRGIQPRVDRLTA